MPENRPKSLDEIVEQARTLMPDERVSFILNACDTDSELRERVFERLASGSSWSVDERSSATFATGDVQNQRFGPYRIVRSLGQGGMGEVFLAERDDDQYRRQVAIKLVRRGLVSKAVQNRLRLERQILATLDHPNIARLFDGGTTTDGVPYIVMEYVDGKPIDAYCDHLRLPIAERLKLFMTVCAAVHRAHQNLVVHRDLKPSNVLVTKDGQPKLLDFGIAKLLDERERLHHTIAVTQLDVRIMTPDHASPEQVLGETITTASDVYVLGVLLYELLTGRKPFELKGNRLAELERAICETDPTPPSGAIAELIRTRPGEAESIAACRGLTPTKLRRELAGDLDNIVLMAMRKEPERRYSSAERLAADVNRYLQRLPVTARPASWAYRTMKFVRRNTLLVALSSLLVVALIGFSGITYVQSQRVKQERDVANAERERAEMQQRRAEAVVSFLIDSFKVSDPALARGREITAREILDNGATKVDEELSGQPDLQATLLDTIGNVYLNLGQPAAALPLIERGLNIRRSIANGESIEVAQSLGSLNRVAEALGDLDRAESLARQGLDINMRLTGPDSLETAGSWCQLGLILYRRLRLTDAERAFRTCLELRIAKLGKEHELLAAPLDSLALIALDKRDDDTAEKLYREAIRIDGRVHGRDHPRYIRHTVNLALVLRDRGDTREAEKLLREAIQAFQRVLGPEHPETISSMLNLGQLLMDRGNLDEAEHIFIDVLEKDRKVTGARSDRVGYDLTRLARVAFLRQDYKRAKALYSEGLDVYKASLQPGHPFIAAANFMLGRTFLALNKPQDAQPVLERALELMNENLGEDSIWSTMCRAALARSWMLQQRLADAEPVLLAAYPLIAKSSRAEDQEMAAHVRTWIEELFRAQNRPEAARAYFAKIAAQ
jgi:serine/threonine protein kinase/tetratricopeptide (TPR) repeat protein